jgi:hypothetical protein
MLSLHSCVPESYLHNLILEFWQEEVHNLILLDGKGVQVDLLHALYLALLDETTKLRNGLPFFLLIFVRASASSYLLIRCTPLCCREKSRTSASTTSISTTAVSSVTSRSKTTAATRGSASARSISHIKSTLRFMNS